MPDRENGHDEPVIRDNRKIDPETGQVREAPSGQQPEVPSVVSQDDELAAQLAERTSDLQRLQAEYTNYRRRVERDRIVVREQAVANALGELLPVLDDIGRARDHGELTGGFAKVAESLEAAVTKLGLSSFGQKGDPFDPMVHEALMHSYSPDVTEPTAIEVLQPGYRMGDRVLRPARVAVAEPAEPEDAPPASLDEDEI
jgi:molecular chaperone GrpE